MGIIESAKATAFFLISCVLDDIMIGHTFALLLMVALVISGPVRPKGEDLFDLYETEKDEIIPIQDTPATVVNMTLSDFSKVAAQNRGVYNPILRTLNVNSTSGLLYNPLLRGVEGSSTPPNGIAEVYSFFPPSWGAFLKGERVPYIYT